MQLNEVSANIAPLQLMQRFSSVLVFITTFCSRNITSEVEIQICTSFCSFVRHFLHFLLFENDRFYTNVCWSKSSRIRNVRQYRAECEMPSYVSDVVTTKETKSYRITVRYWELSIFLTKVNLCCRPFDGR